MNIVMEDLCQCTRAMRWNVYEWNNMVLETGSCEFGDFIGHSSVNRCHRNVRRCRCPGKGETFTKKETGQPAWSPEFPKPSLLLTFTLLARSPSHDDDSLGESYLFRPTPPPPPLTRLLQILVVPLPPPFRQSSFILQNFNPE